MRGWTRLLALMAVLCVTALTACKKDPAGPDEEESPGVQATLVASAPSLLG